MVNTKGFPLDHTSYRVGPLCPPEYKVKDSSRLCAKHFDLNDFFPTPEMRGKRLLAKTKPRSNNKPAQEGKFNSLKSQFVAYRIDYVQPQKT